MLEHLKTTDHDADGIDLVCAVCLLDILRYEAKTRVRGPYMPVYVHDGECMEEYELRQSEQSLLLSK